MLAVVGLNAASILGLVAGGTLPAYRNFLGEFCCGDILFEPADLRRCIVELKDKSHWMSRAETARFLKVKDKTLAKWVSRQLLSPVAIHTNTQYFDRGQVERFPLEYITSEEAASFLGVGKLCVQQWVRQGRLRAISGPGVDDCHMYRFKKDDLIQWHTERVNFGTAVRMLGVSDSTLHRWIEEGYIEPLDDMGGTQRWFSRKAVVDLGLRLSRELEIACAIKGNRRIRQGIAPSRKTPR